jgi:hypothetical protein
MYVAVDAPAAARAAIGWRLPDYGGLSSWGLVDLPDAPRASKEGERHGAADWQQFSRPHDRHANCAAWCAIIVRTGAAEAEARGGEAAIGPALKVVQPPRAVAARAVVVQLKAVAGDVANGLEWKLGAWREP